MPKDAARRAESGSNLWVDIGARIAERMDALEMTHDALAKKIGKDRSYVTRLINGKRKGAADVGLLSRIADALDVDMSALLPGAQPDGSTGMSDPRSTVSSSNNEHVEGYTVKTDEARIVAKMLDALPEDLRPLAMTEMITAWRRSDANPSAPSVDRRPGHARKTS